MKEMSWIKSIKNDENHNWSWKQSKWVSEWVGDMLYEWIVTFFTFCYPFLERKKKRGREWEWVSGGVREEGE